MTDRREENPSGPDVLFGYLIPLVIVGLSIADFARDGQIDKYLLGLLGVFGLAALGYRVDDILTRYVANRFSEPEFQKDSNNDK